MDIEELYRQYPHLFQDVKDDWIFKSLERRYGFNEAFETFIKSSKLGVLLLITKRASKEIDLLRNILKNALNQKTKISIEEALKDLSSFGLTKPKKPRPILTKPIKPELVLESTTDFAAYQYVIPRPPENLTLTDRYNKDYKEYANKIDELARANKRIRKQKYQEILKRNEAAKMKFSRLEEEYQRDLAEWEKGYPRQRAEQMERYKKDLAKWERLHQKFLKKQKEINEPIEEAEKGYLTGEKLKVVVVAHLSKILSCSEYPSYFFKKFELDYSPSTQMLIVDYNLPAPEDLPRIKECKYVKNKGEIEAKYLSESFINSLYDDLIYQIALRTIYELYTLTLKETLGSIVFNGWVRSTNRATGQKVDNCILSIQVSRDEFLSINFADIDAKMCFKHLKGIGSSKLYSITPIAPILTINREDKRFISSYEVAKDIDESTNLAAMDWEDFEHLIRELFEKEFSQYDGEVKITQASRDRGVDAVAFDPDPIRGGKIVIQAKRYTNTVGVDSVRDLYGTIINEGATKGILITTADYGPDAYEFAKGKPITLLNGGNLLHLLHKHGHKAKIDLMAAKLILSEKERNRGLKENNRS
ncbi:MAG: restriction endonuclease [Proteobacteria bacterium]|nr:restriction endonuclease [Pseudomonadota bacterium]